MSTKQPSMVWEDDDMGNKSQRISKWERKAIKQGRKMMKAVPEIESIKAYNELKRAGISGHVLTTHR